LSRVLALLLATPLCGCEPNLTIGRWDCTTLPDAAGPLNDGGVLQPVHDALALPWSTGFEDAFCGYGDAKGFCYHHGPSTMTLVGAPVHSGRQALSLGVDSADAGGFADTRCAREGEFPPDAYYGAWFYLSVLPDSVQDWNLLHFQGGNGTPSWKNLWDVTLVKTGDGGFGLTVVESVAGGPTLAPQSPPDVPVGTWFHVVLRFVRSADANGEITLYQDDRELFDAKGVTDPFPYDQWYAGNYVASTTQPDLIVYMDDVTVSSTQP
jgi:hypothetical protein